MALVEAIEEPAKDAAAQVHLMGHDPERLALEELGARGGEIVVDLGFADRPGPAVVRGLCACL